MTVVAFEWCFQTLEGHDLPAHLYLLDFGSRSATRKVLALLRSDCESDLAAGADAVRLVVSPEWRENLIGAAAGLYLHDRAAAVAATWDRVWRSWVSPQLVVLLEHLDPAFDQRAPEALREIASHVDDPTTTEPEKALGALRAVLTARGVALPELPSHSVPDDVLKPWEAFASKLRDALAVVLESPI